MKLDNEFTVGVPIGEAWGVLTDLEMIAPCMPGAQLTGVNDGVYTGKVKIKVGPVTAEYSGTARFAEKDQQTYRAVIDARGRDSRGNGNATAVISAQLMPAGESTRVTVSTDLAIAGRIAQFGSGMIKEVSAKLLGQFTDCLERRLGGASEPTAAPASVPGTAAAVAMAGQAAVATAGQAATGPASATAAAPASASASATTAAPASTAVPTSTAVPSSSPEPAALDLMSVAGGAIYKRLVPVVAALVVLGVVIWLIVR